MAAIHAAASDDRPWSAAEFAALLASPGCFATGDVRAFALVRVILDEAELLTIATRPQHRRQGLARALMADWQAEAARRGATRAFLEVAADNAPARALYEACGYSQTGRRRGYYRRGTGAAVDALLMARTLP
ncbi:GNAT family N-acetyltransferase [Pseudooceanicola sp.]|uniref:GNAT family N-acetyltransferase n=1 Tax=Pseudooceanicola sp. TaxID=1914328 RepID=UPI003513CEBF